MLAAEIDDRHRRVADLAVSRVHSARPCSSVGGKLHLPAPAIHVAQAARLEPPDHGRTVTDSSSGFAPPGITSVAARMPRAGLLLPTGGELPIGMRLARRRAGRSARNSSISSARAVDFARPAPSL